MNRITKFFSISALSLLALGLPAIASAQYGGYPNGGYGYPNGGYGNGGYGNNRGYNGNVVSAARELKDLSHRFEKDLDRSPLYSKQNNRGGGWYGGGYGGYGNSGDSSYVRKLADQFADAASDLNGRVGNGRNNDGYNEASRVMNLGSQLDNALRQRGLDNYLQDDWNRIQYDMRVISQTYGNGYNNGRGGRNGGYNGGNNGGWSNRPSWWPF
ncbi:MAG: hypothetical protein JO314_11405 [Acidobacteria bacterium]|nr:hypothetical protein [Acidobacteriota bacterium]